MRTFGMYMKRDKRRAVLSWFGLLLALMALASLAACSLIGEESNQQQATDIAQSLESLESGGEVSLAQDDPASLFSSDNPTLTNFGMARAFTPIRSEDDKGTPSDPSDDEITLISETRHWAGFSYVRVLIRPKRPTSDAAWNGWWASAVDNKKSQNAYEYWYNNLEAAQSDSSRTPGSHSAQALVTISLTWQNLSGVVTLESMTRSGERLGLRAGQPYVVESTASWTSGTLTRRVLSFYQGSVSPANLRFVETWTFASGSITIVKTGPSGQSLNKRVIVRGSDSSTNSWTISVYRGAEERLARTIVRTEQADGSGYTSTITTYRADGVTVKQTMSESVTITVSGDTRTVVRTFSTDNTSKTLTFSVTRLGDTYTVTRTLPNGTTQTWTASQDSSGSWTITSTTGEEFVLDAI